MQSDIVQRLKELRAFLDGSGELNGLSFGDDPPIINGIRRAFWWRKELTALDEAAAEIARLNSAIKLQAAAVRTLQANEQTEINMLRAKAREAHIAIATLDSEREANAILTEALRAAEEREKALREALFNATPTLATTPNGYGGRKVLLDYDDSDQGMTAYEALSDLALKENPHADAYRPEPSHE